MKIFHKGTKRPEAEIQNQTLTTDEVKNTWNYISTPPYFFWLSA
jgi:hypothetical protein